MMRVAMAAQERRLRCRERGQRRGALRLEQTEASALQAVPPATGTPGSIGHLTGRVIWDGPKPSCCKQLQPAIAHIAPGATRLCIRSAAGVRVRGRQRLGARLPRWVHAAFAEVRVAKSGRRSASGTVPAPQNGPLADHSPHCHPARTPCDMSHRDPDVNQPRAGRG